MKRLYIYIFAVMAALLQVACTEDLGLEERNVATGKLRFVIPTWTDSNVDTRAGVTSEDIGISAGSMQLLCFDKDGFYLGMGDGTTITPETNYEGTITAYEGTITAKVPSGTCRIHFIANANLENNAKWIGMNENTLIASLTATEGAQMVYWGYKKCSTADEMQAFLVSDSEVLMLRNEAKVSVTNEPEEGIDLGEDAIKKIYLTVCEDLKYGTLAPFDYTNLDNPFAYDETSQTAVTLPADITKRTEPTDVGRDTEQFIFEASNSTKQPIKVVLKVTYTDDVEKYHQIQLRDNEYALHKIRRNHNYKIKIKKLDRDLGYDTFAGAINGHPSNNLSASVDDVVPEVSKDGYTLRIVGSTSRLYNETGEKTVQFQFLGDNTMTADNFNVEWSENNGISEPSDLTFSYDTSSQTGTITFPIDKLTGSLQRGTILVRDTKYGLERNVHIYAVSTLNFNGSIKGIGTATEGTIHEVETKETKENITVTLGAPNGLKDVASTDWRGDYSYSQYKNLTFTFTGDNSVTKDDFQVTVSGNSVSSASITSYSNGAGTIRVYLRGPENWSQSNYYTGQVVLTNTTYDISRTINVYTTKKSNYVTVDVNNGETSKEVEKITTEIISEKDVSVYTYDSYALTFTIPDDFPDDLLPIKVKIATSELQPDNSKNRLDVVVESTADIGEKDLNYWYVYTADKTAEEKGKDKTYTIYMMPIRDNVDKGNVYLKTDYFETQTISANILK